MKATITLHEFSRIFSLVNLQMILILYVGFPQGAPSECCLLSEPIYTLRGSAAMLLRRVYTHLVLISVACLLWPAFLVVAMRAHVLCYS